MKIIYNHILSDKITLKKSIYLILTTLPVTLTLGEPHEPYHKKPDPPSNSTLSFHSSQSQVAFAHTSPSFRAETVPVSLFFTPLFLNKHSHSSNAITPFNQTHHQSTHSSGTLHLLFSFFSQTGLHFFHQFSVFHFFYLRI